MKRRPWIVAGALLVAAGGASAQPAPSSPPPASSPPAGAPVAPLERKTQRGQHEPIGGGGFGDDGALPSDPKAEYHSPQHFAFELKFGPYSPNIDASPGLNGATPFADLFNNQFTTPPGTRPAGKLLTTLEIDWQFLHGFGSLGLGASWGVSSRSSHSFQYAQIDASTGAKTSCTVPNCLRSSDLTTLTVMPFALELVYRFDVLALHYKVPIVPYLKGGVAYYLWFVQRGDGSLSKVTDATTGNTDKAVGGTFGLVAHPGVAVLLDVLDPSAARVMDAELGINHTYVFAELNYAWITGLGSHTKMVFSDLTWNCGIAFEF
jgi:hypothetical protein